MVDVIFARALHVLAIVIWLGGVSMVTTVVLPMVKRNFPAEDRLEVFRKIENRFALEARITTLLAAATGFYMAWRMNLWSYFDLKNISAFWWMHAMVCVWLIFTIMLFVIEPFFVHKRLRRGQSDPEKMYKRMQTLHWILLTLGLITIIGAVMGSWGYQF